MLRDPHNPWPWLSWRSVFAVGRLEDRGEQPVFRDIWDRHLADNRRDAQAAAVRMLTGMASVTWD